MRLIDAEELFNKVGEIKPRNEEHYKAIGEFMNMITNSSTIESTTITTSTDEPVVINYPIIICDDVVSREREAIINAIYKMELSNWVKDEIEKTIRELPPVESSHKVIEDIKAEIQYEADNKADMYSMQGYYNCLDIIDKHTKGDKG